MQRYNEQLVKAGVMLAGEGLKPTSAGVKVRFDGGRRTVVDGPFAETKELIAGFCLLQVKTKEQAVEWGKRFLQVVGQGESEIRQICDPPGGT